MFTQAHRASLTAGAATLAMLMAHSTVQAANITLNIMKKLLVGLAMETLVLGIISPHWARATTIDIWDNFPRYQGDNGFFAYGYAAATDTYWLLSEAADYSFYRPEEGRWNNPHVEGVGPYSWYGKPWIAIFPSGTASNTGYPEDAVLGWIVPAGTASYELTGSFYVRGESLNGADAYIKNNSTTLWSAYISPGSAQSFDIVNLILNPGDMIYFGAGAHNNMYFSEYNDWPFFNGRIISTQLNPPTPTPEPATMLLFGTGIAGLVGSRIKRKKK